MKQSFFRRQVNKINATYSAKRVYHAIKKISTMKVKQRIEGNANKKLA